MLLFSTRKHKHRHAHLLTVHELEEESLELLDYFAVIEVASSLGESSSDLGSSRMQEGAAGASAKGYIVVREATRGQARRPAYEGNLQRAQTT